MSGKKYIYIVDRIPPGKQGYKVGIAKDPHNRAGRFATYLPEEKLVFSMLIDNAHQVEQNVLQRFTNYRVRHEKGSLSEVIYSALAEIKAVVLEEIIKSIPATQTMPDELVRACFARNNDPRSSFANSQQSASPSVFSSGFNSSFSLASQSGFGSQQGFAFTAY